MNLNVLAFALFAVGRYKGTVGLVKDVEKALVKREAGAQDRPHHDAVRVDAYVLLAERRLHLANIVLQTATQFVGHRVRYALQIVAKKRAVALNINVAKLHHIAVDDGVGRP